MPKHYLGIDLGGTNIKAGIVDDAGRVLSRGSAPTPGKDGFEAVCSAIARLGGEVAQRAGLTLGRGSIAAAGVGTPGLIDFDHGAVLNAPNLPGWTDVPLAKRMSDLLGLPTVIENDANAAAFGEYWAGAGRGEGHNASPPDPLVMLTLGTGVGGGIVIGGRVLHGGFGLAAEVGHLILHPGNDGLPCGCGQRGCLELYASANAAARRAKEAVQTGRPTSLRSCTEPTAKDLFDHAQAGDVLAVEVAQGVCNDLAWTCITLARVLDPKMIVFAGGMALAGDWMFDRIRRSFRERTWRIASADTLAIVPARLGNDAGIIGAAGVAWEVSQRGVLP